MKENIDIRLLTAKEAIESEMFEEAINILDELIAENCSEAMVIRSGIGLADESAEDMNNREINLLTKAALLGNAEALYYMSIHYDTGDIVNVDKDLAIFYSELAAEKKHPHALWRRGMRMLYQKNNVEQGLKIIEEAAALKSEGAIRTLASFYQNGEFGYPKDAHKARELMSMAESDDCLLI